jgi:nitroimidazol reductase NimA-like FMN-containing flavoprotein (pyridoxamine 5'-phosphate oxidase superfamily)
MSDGPPNERTTLKRLPNRGVYDRDSIHRILDDGMICHVGFLDDGQPCVVPTLYVRLEDRIYLHGSPASRMLRALVRGGPVCVAVTLVDGLVLARSAFHHSMNYRSVVIYGTAEEVEDPARKASVLHGLSDHVIPGRWQEVRGPSELELRKTLVVSIGIDEASAKVRTGPPLDDEPDYALPVWAGVVPLHLTAGEPVPDARLQPGIAPPSYATWYKGPAVPHTPEGRHGHERI